MRHVAVLVALAVMLGFPITSKGVGLVRWTVSHNTRDMETLILGVESRQVALGGGWLCTVGKLSDQLPSYQARQTVCVSSGRAVEFSIQCERDRPKDHTQLRFTDASGEALDFIDVACELEL